MNEIRVKECRLRPLEFSDQVVVEVIYLVRLTIVYDDQTGFVRTTVFQKELSQRSRAIPGN